MSGTAFVSMGHQSSGAKSASAPLTELRSGRHYSPSLLGVCLCSAAFAAATASLAEGVLLWLQSESIGQSHEVALATAYILATLIPPALLIGLLQTIAMGAYPAGAGVRGGLGDLGRWFAGLTGGRGNSHAVAVLGTLVGLAYAGSRLGPEELRSLLPADLALSPLTAQVTTLALLSLGLYTVLRTLAAMILPLGAALGLGSPAPRQVMLPFACIIATVAATVAVAGGGSIEALGGREPALVLVFAVTQAAFATALSLPAAQRGRALRSRLWATACLAMLPALHGLVFQLHLDPPVRDALLDETHLANRLLGVYQLRFDEDGDGFSALIGGLDCDDTNGLLHPKSRDIPGDGIDQNCDGFDARKPPEKPLAPPPEPPPAEPQRPRYNVVLITVDTLRADRLSAYGYARRTSPNIDRFARTGNLFEHFWAQGPNTKYSTSSMFTGRYFSEISRCKHLWVHIDPAEQTMAEPIQAAGIHTAAVPTHGFFQEWSGLMGGFDEIDLHLVKKYGRGVNWRPMAHETTRRAIRQLNKLEAKKEPFFLWIHYYDPHSAYMRHKNQPNWGNEPGDLYDGEVLFLDRSMGPLFKRLSSEERLKDTAVLINSDHGEGLKDHGYIYHGRTLYDDQIRVPLILRVPGAEPRKIPTSASNIDLARTVLDLMQVEAPEHYQGESLVPFILQQRVDEPDRLIYTEIAEDPKHTPLRALIRWPYKLLLNVKSGRRKLFDLQKDPKERKNLSRSHPEVVREMSDELAGFVENKLKWREAKAWPGHELLRTYP